MRESRFPIAACCIDYRSRNKMELSYDEYFIATPVKSTIPAADHPASKTAIQESHAPFHSTISTKISLTISNRTHPPRQNGIHNRNPLEIHRHHLPRPPNRTAPLLPHSHLTTNITSPRASPTPSAPPPSPPSSPYRPHSQHIPHSSTSAP